MITIDDFKKIELKVAKVLTAEHIEGSDKLLKLQIDLGIEQRQILSGIAKYYKPEDLVGRQIVVVTNLEPRVFNIKSDGPVRSKTPEASADMPSASRTSNGMESQGMILAAGDGEVVSVLIPDKEMPPGTPVK